MNFRRSIFYICSVLALILFVDGVFTLYTMNKEQQNTEFRSKYNPIEIVRRNIGQKEEAPQCLNLLILGLDEEEVRSDVIALLNYRPKEGKINILSIARDTRVKAKGRFMKINALIGTGGERLVVEKVEEITGLPINYYLTLNFKGFREIIDTLGGVEIDVPFDMEYDDPYQNLHIHIKKGKQVLDGAKSEQFVRYRKGNHKGQGYQDGDIGRIKIQQQFIKEFIEQKIKVRYILKANDIFFILKDNMRTNIEISDVNHFIKYIKDIRSDEVKSYTLPGYSSYIGGQWYYIYNKKKTKELIKSYFSP
ncbi:MAG: LCP family protein [Bacillota bacterium]